MPILPPVKGADEVAAVINAGAFRHEPLFPDRIVERKRIAHDRVACDRRFGVIIAEHIAAARPDEGQESEGVAAGAVHREPIAINVIAQGVDGAHRFQHLVPGRGRIVRIQTGLLKQVDVVDDERAVYARWHGVIASLIPAQFHVRRRQGVGVGQFPDEIGDIDQLPGGREGRCVDQINAGDIGRFARGDGGAHLRDKLAARDDGQLDLAIVVGVPLIDQRLRLEGD